MAEETSHRRTDPTASVTRWQLERFMDLVLRGYGDRIVRAFPEPAQASVQNIVNKANRDLYLLIREALEQSTGR